MKLRVSGALGALMWAAAWTGAAVADEVSILAQPIAVAARLDAQPGDPAQSFPFTLTVSRGGRSFALKTIIVGVADQDEAVDVLRQTIGWKERYLFVREECGGGNAWRCNVDQVFAVRGDRLVRLGEQMGGSRSQGPGAFFRGGYFVDMYDRLENNALTTHAAAPSFAIYLRESGDAMAVDLARTWKEGRATFERDRKDIARAARDSHMDPGTRAQTVASPLLHNATLARYCERNDELERTLRDAHALLPAAQWETFEGIVDRVRPGELPAPRR